MNKKRPSIAAWLLCAALVIFGALIISGVIPTAYHNDANNNVKQIDDGMEAAAVAGVIGQM